MGLLGHLSLRGILALVEKTADPLRPTRKEDIEDQVLRQRWDWSSQSASGLRHLWRIILRGRDKTVDLALKLLDNLAFDRLVFKDEFKEVSKTLFEDTERHRHVLPRVGIESVPRGNFVMVETDSLVVQTRFPRAVRFLPKE